MADKIRRCEQMQQMDMPQGNAADVRMLDMFMDIGAMMIRNGSEVKRVEDTLRRMGAAYGAERMDVFAITSTLVCTMNMPDGTVCSMSRGTRDGAKTDFWKLERINALSREYCKEPFGMDELKSRIDEIEQMAAPRLTVCVGSVLAAGTLGYFLEEVYSMEWRLRYLPLEYGFCRYISHQYVPTTYCLISCVHLSLEY